MPLFKNRKERMSACLQRRQAGQEDKAAEALASTHTIVSSNDQSCVRVVLYMLKVLSVHLGLSGNDTSLWINL
jgi:hypothetical protein